MTWLAHFLGIDNVSGHAYAFWSGAGSDIGELGIVAALVGMLRRHNCETHGCWRLGRHVTAAGHRVCRRHHPDGPLSAADVLKADAASRGRM